MPNNDPIQEHDDIERARKLLRTLDVDAYAAPTVPDVTQPHSRLERARTINHRTQEELHTIVEGLNAKIAQIGIVVAEANKPHGMREHVLTILGNCGFNSAKHNAAALRQVRLHDLNLTAVVDEIGQYVKQTIQNLGESETEYKVDVAAYQKSLDEILKKQELATPQYLAAQVRRALLKTQVDGLEALAKGASENDRPAAEGRYEIAQRELEQAQLEESTFLATVKEATEAIPRIQIARNAAADAIQSLHSMRQGMLEKFLNFKSVLERASTAMKALARIEMYQSTDPAFNKTIEVILENNVATSGAALEVWADRLKHAAIDPEKSQQLLQELLGHITDYARDLQQAEAQVKAGPRVKLSDLMEETEKVEVAARR